MAGITVDTDALQQAANALSTYIESVSDSIQKMKDAAIDCSDNMGSDAYSQKAIEELEVCAQELSITLRNAEELRSKILARKQQIEHSI